MANNREISQFAGLVTVNDTTNDVSIGATVRVGSGITFNADLTGTASFAGNMNFGTNVVFDSNNNRFIFNNDGFNSGTDSYAIVQSNGQIIAFADAADVSNGTGMIRVAKSGSTVIGLGADGNISASGIVFGAGGASKTLDDYEEGTWTPIWTGNGASIGSGTYTKIGRLVTLHASITFPITSNTATQVLGGLPFNASGSNNFAGYSIETSNATYPGFVFRYSATQYFTVRSASAQNTDLQRNQTSGIAAIICLQYSV